MLVLIKNARIVDARSPHDGQVCDVLLDNGLIRQIGSGLSAPDTARLLNGPNLHLSPGWVDLRAQTHDPGAEHKEDLTSLCRAAVAGGYTDVALLPNTNPPTDTKNAVSYVRQQTRGQGVTVHPIGAVTRKTAGLDFADMLDLHHAGAVGFSDGTHPLHDPDLFIKTVQYLYPIGGLLMNRPEEPALTRFGQMHEGRQSTLLGLKGIPAIAETIIVERDLQLLAYALEHAKRADDAGPVLHFSGLSSARSVALVRAAKAAGLPVSCDVAAHQLVFDEAALATFDTNLKVNPPFRTVADRDALWAGLADGTIDAVVSDHNPQDEDSKNTEFDQAEFGVTGLETAFAAVVSYNHTLSLAQIVDVFSRHPRRILRLPPVYIAEGQPARLTVFDPAEVWTYDQTMSKSRNSPFWGQTLTGKAVGTFI
jgi:dihydroorotase